MSKVTYPKSSCGFYILVSVIGAFLTLPDEFSQAIAHMIQAGHGHERIDFWPDATTLKSLA
jgi:hypothetical protein